MLFFAFISLLQTFEKISLLTSNNPVSNSLSIDIEQRYKNDVELQFLTLKLRNIFFLLPTIEGNFHIVGNEAKGPTCVHQGVRNARFNLWYYYFISFRLTTAVMITQIIL